MVTRDVKQVPQTTNANDMIVADAMVDIDAEYEALCLGAVVGA